MSEIEDRLAEIQAKLKVTHIRRNERRSWEEELTWHSRDPLIEYTKSLAVVDVPWLLELVDRLLVLVDKQNHSYSELVEANFLAYNKLQERVRELEASWRQLVPSSIQEKHECTECDRCWCVGAHTAPNYAPCHHGDQLCYGYKVQL